MRNGRVKEMCGNKFSFLERAHLGDWFDHIERLGEKRMMRRPRKRWKRWY